MTQSAIALLRQQMEYGHIYDMTKLAQNPVPMTPRFEVLKVPSRHRRASSSSGEEVVAGFFFAEFGRSTVRSSGDAPRMTRSPRWRRSRDTTSSS